LRILIEINNKPPHQHGTNKKQNLIKKQLDKFFQLKNKIKRNCSVAKCFLLLSYALFIINYELIHYESNRSVIVQIFINLQQSKKE